MALLHKKGSEIPADAVRLSEDEAVNYFRGLVRGWEHQGEVWPMLYTPGILGASTVATGFYLNNHFRTALRLGSYGRLSSYLPAVALPAIMASLFHGLFVQPDVILRRNACPVCLQTRAAAVQAGLSIAYPLLLVPLSSFMFATRHFTYRLPSITEQPKAVLQVFRKITGPITLPLTLLLSFNVALSIFLTGKEFETVHRINIRLLELERHLESEGVLPAL
ncbi:uncharacterized protein LOC125950376 [Anopheles darlingi]|uniref:uncharacterized protein LOC125950376 n=1 Tax=Anopheles darlingi TaxID=43151 RepID=UPI0021005C7D|nr:uncharacterized protein LOC125950376 [Anopheles darlingi]